MKTQQALSSGAGTALPTVRRGLVGAAAVSLALLILMAYLPDGAYVRTATSDVLQLAAALTAAVAAFAAARRTTGRMRAGWAFLGLAMAAWAAGQADWTWREVVQRSEVPSIGPGDAAFLAMPLLAIAAVLCFAPVHTRRGVVWASIILDGLLVTVGSFTLLWPLALEGLFQSYADQHEALFALAYPLSDIALVGMAGGVMMRSKTTWRTNLGAIFVSFALLAVSDLAYALELFDSGYITGGLLDAGWLLGLWGIAWACCLPAHEARAALSVPISGRLLPLAAGAAGFIGFVLELRLHDQPGPAWRIATGLLILAALGRQYLFTTEYKRIVRQRESAFGDLARSQQTVRVMTLGQQAIGRAANEQEVMDGVCQLLTGEGGYMTAWVGMAQDDADKSVRVASAAGKSKEAVAQVKASWDAASPRGQGPTGRALREGTSQVAQDIRNDPRMAPWMKVAAANGVAASCSIPFSIAGDRGALIVYAPEPRAFAPDEVGLLEQLVAQMAYGIQAQRERAAKAAAEEAIRRSEEHLRLAQEVGFIGSWSYDIVKDEAWWSPAMFRLFGRDPATYKPGYSSVLDSMHPDDREATSKSFQHAIAHHLNWDQDHRVVLADGTVRTIAAHAAFFYDETGKPIRAVGTSQDITQRTLAESELRKAKEAAEAADRAKTLFLAVMSHEVRTPMNGIIGMAELLSATPLSDEQKAMLGTISSSGEHLLTLINHVLDFAKIRSGGLVLDQKSIDLRRFVAETAQIVRPQANNKHVAIEVRVADDVPPLVLGDRPRLREVVLNLLSNGVKFTERGSVTIEVSTAPAGPSRVRVQMRFIDTGIGIPADRLDLLFKPFSQVDPSYSRKFEGSGMGLAIAQGIAQAMGGEITVTSVPGLGSTFQFQFLADITARPEEERPVARAVPDAASLRLLVVEDNSMNRKVMARMLDQLGFHADEATDGQEAVDAVDSRPYDVILMDVHMPRMDGFEAARMIRARHPHEPRIIAVTADAMPEDRQKCLDAGMDDYLSKPIRQVDLERVLRRRVAKT